MVAFRSYLSLSTGTADRERGWERGGGRAGEKIECVLLLAKNIFFLGLELMNYGMKSDLETPEALK